MSYLIGGESHPNMELIGTELSVLSVIVTKFCCHFTDSRRIALFTAGRGKRSLYPPKRLDRPWGLSSLLLSGYQGSYPGIKRLGREIDHLPTCSAEVKNVWGCTSTATVFLHGVDMDDFIIIISIRCCHYKMTHFLYLLLCIRKFSCDM
jgi:hypothetical protein